MKNLTFESLSFYIGDNPVYLLSGEFHYFRVPKTDWRRRMSLFKEAGGNCLATYIPWLLHEPQEGSFTFGKAADWLDLEGFLQTAREMDLYVIARPGPYQYSELVYDGLPGWLCEQYPSIRARNWEGQPFRISSVSYLHPIFLEKVQGWFDKVCPILARYTCNQGGPVAFVQIDNEMAGIHEWFGSLDYNPESMGFGKESGRYPLFLQQRYTEIQALNQHYGSHFTDFSQVNPPDPREEQNLNAIRRRKDYFDFYLGTIAEYAVRLVEMIREHDINAPIIHNSANPGMNAYFLETIDRLGDTFLLGSDHYYTLGQDWPQNNPTPQYAARIFVSLEMLRLLGYPPTVLELPGGSASDWPPVTPEDALTCYLTNLAYGMKGSNYYIFTGGPNPPGAGATTDLYDFGAGIGSGGDIRPLYQAQKTFGTFVQGHAWLVQAEKAADCRFALDFEHSRAVHYWGNRADFQFSNLEAWNFLRKGPLTSSLCASLSPQFVDLGSDDWLADNSTPLWAVSSSSMAADKQTRLVRFLNSGGKMILGPVLPVVDENLKPCTILADFLGGPQIYTNPQERARLRIGDQTNVSGKVLFSDHLPAECQVIGVDELSGQTVAWKYILPAGGQIIFLGLHWSHAMREHERLLLDLFTASGGRQLVRCSNPNIWTTLWRSGDRAMLYVLNLFTAPMNAEISIRLNPSGEEILLPDRRYAPVSVETYELNLGGGDA